MLANCFLKKTVKEKKNLVEKYAFTSKTQIKIYSIPPLPDYILLHSKLQAIIIPDLISSHPIIRKIIRRKNYFLKKKPFRRHGKIYKRRIFCFDDLPKFLYLQFSFSNL